MESISICRNKARGVASGIFGARKVLWELTRLSGKLGDVTTRSRGFDWFCLFFKFSSQVQVRSKLRRIFHQQNSKSTVCILNAETVIAVACRKKNN